MFQSRLAPSVLTALLATTVTMSARQPPVFRGGVQYVVVDVVVTDCNDRPITDLERLSQGLKPLGSLFTALGLLSPGAQ